LQRLPYNEIYDIRVAPSSSTVTDVISSMWVHECVQHEAVLQEASLELEEVQAAHQSAQAKATRELEELQAAHHSAQVEAVREFAEAQAAQQLLQAEAVRRIDQLHSESLQSLCDIKTRDALIDELERQFHRITTSRSWRWTWPTRAAMYLLRGYGLVGKADHIVAGQLRQQLRRLRQQIRALAAPNPVAASNVPLAMAENSQRDVFIWAVIDWNYRIQRP
jgi:hypothetical protein